MLKTKDDIVKNWLPRYTGMPLDEFGQYILLTNFQDYVNNFAKLTGAKIYGMEKSMQSATSDNITPLNLINIRRVAYGLMELSDLRGPSDPVPEGSCSCGSTLLGTEIDSAVSAVQRSAAAGGHGELSADDIEAITRAVIARLKR